MTRPKNIDAYLSGRFYNPKSSGSFTSATKLYDVIKREGRYDISLKRVKRWAEGQDILTLHKTSGRKPPAYRKIVAPGINHLWDTDILVLSGRRFASANDAYAYILVTVDVFSRYCRAKPLKSKGAKDVSDAFAEIFEECGTPPKFCRSDRGKEYDNSRVRDLFADKGVKHYFCTTETKASYAEALIKTLKRKLFQFFQKTNSYRYIDKFTDIVSSYNDTIHSAIGRPPSDVTSKNESDVWYYQYVSNSPHYKRTLLKALRNTDGKRSDVVYRYSVGDTVRLAYFASRPFTRAYDELFTGEVFTVRDRKIAGGIPVYYLTDFSGEKLEGNFYASELTAVRYDPNAYFKIEKVLKTRVRNGVVEKLIKYQSWPSKYNDWIPASGIKNLRRK